MGNEELRAKYDAMHKQGVTSWFSDGREERETILKMGEPWEGKFVLEFGCGEGDLSATIFDKGSSILAFDYSSEAIKKAKNKYPELAKKYVFRERNYRDIVNPDPYPDTIVMQGVLEHLDNPFAELQWMIEHFKPKDVITSSPCFLNPRGIVWMTLDMLGAVMSKTDLHFLHPWDFMRFCDEHEYDLKWANCDYDWGAGVGMIEDLKKRIPLALKDGAIEFKKEKIEQLIDWLSNYVYNYHIDWNEDIGATMVYRITK